MLALTTPYETIFHRWPASWKVIMLLTFTTGLMMIQTQLLLLCTVAVPFFLIALQGWRYLWFSLKLLRPLWSFVAIILIWHLYTADFQSGLSIILKLAAAFAFANLVTTTTSLTDFSALIEQAMAPFDRNGTQSRKFGLMIALTLRFIPVFIERASLLCLAHRARSTKHGTWRIIFPLALSALDDAEHVAESLNARGGATPR